MKHAFVLLVFFAAIGYSDERWQRLDLAVTLAASDPAEAKKEFEAILLDAPDFQAASFNLGTLLLESDPNAAVNHLQAATASPQVELAADAWANLAQAYSKLGRLKDAFAAAVKAVELRPDDENGIALRNELRRLYLARLDEARRKKEEEAKKLHLETKTLPDAHVGEAYAQTIKAGGGAGEPYKFTISGDAKLPEGLALENDGRLHGTPGPAAVGKHELKIALQDSKETVNGDLTLIVIPAPAIVTEELPEAVIDQPYSADLEAIGLARTTWTVEGLPEGLTLKQGFKATIEGSTNKTGKHRLGITVTDGERTAKKVLMLSVTDLFAPERSELPPATAWANYQYPVKVRGPTQRYRWQAAPVQGVSIADDGTVSGTPEKAGDVELPPTILAEDGRKREVTLKLHVNPPPVIEVEDPLTVHEGEATNKALKVTGGTPPYQWQVNEGAMPKGLRLDPDGSLRGSAGEVGEFKLTVACQDTWHASTQQSFTLKVEPKSDSQDQNKDQNQDQNKDQQTADNKDEQKKDDQQKQQGDQKDQAKKDDQKQQSGDKQDAEKNDAQKAGEQEDQARREEQAQQINGAAADRWLEQLPDEDRKVLRYQLLDGGQHRTRQHGNPW